MQSFKRQIYKFGLIEDNDKNPPTVDDNNAEYTSGIFEFDTSHFTNNFQDLDSDSYELTRIRTLPLVGTLKYAGNLVREGFIFDLNNISNLTYELPNNYMISLGGYCEFDDPISTIISQQETEGFELTYLGSGKLEFEKVVTSSLPNDTDIYAFFDATSMKIEDAQAAQSSLLEWYNLFKTNNTAFTGKLYILPVVKENWLDFPNIVWRGSSDRVRNNSDRPEDNFMALAILPPNFNILNNTENTSWVPPTKIVTLAFIDEVDSGAEAYHKNRNGYGFDSQPTTQYLTDYRNFKNNYENNFEFFKGVLYPIPDIEYGNFNNIGNAMVLQGFAAIEGDPTYTLTQIKDLGVTYAEERRFHWHLDPTNPYYTGRHLTIANPYSVAAQTPVPNTNYNLQGLKTFGWTGVYDKDQPASSVFTSDTFNLDLNEYLQGSVISTRETKVIRGECVQAGDICFDFQTSDDSSYNLFSNIATFCFTGTNDPENVDSATPPTVDSITRPYNEPMDILSIADFTNNFQDLDGDSYNNIRLESEMTTTKGTVLEGLLLSGTPTTIGQVIPSSEVIANNLTFNIGANNVVLNGRIFQYTDTLVSLIHDMEINGFSILDINGAEYTFYKINTIAPESPIVEIIKGNDIGNSTINLSFRISDDSTYNLYSNLAKVNLTLENANTPPIVGDFNGAMTSSEFIFGANVFSTDFTDMEGDSPLFVKIESEIEATLGEMTFKGLNLEVPYSFPISEVEDLKYTVDERFVFQNGNVFSFDKSVDEYTAELSPDGWILASNENGILRYERTVSGELEFKYISGNTVTTKEYCFNFRVTDDNFTPLFSNVATVCLEIPETETAIDFNQPPTVGDNTIEL